MGKRKETPPIWAILSCLVQMARLLVELHGRHWL